MKVAAWLPSAVRVELSFAGIPITLRIVARLLILTALATADAGPALSPR
jgi:hypothetical protein